ncbi:DUF2635 domain-containing protein (plasmid) [Orbus sturtevantii]
MFVKPKEGRTIRDPVTKEILPENGATVQKSPFWLRRLRDGDVELIKEKK